MTPAGAFNAYPTLTSAPEATGITAGADGNLWFNERGLGHTADCPHDYGGGVGRVTPAGAMSYFGAGCNDTNDQFNIVAGPDGNVWNVAYYGIGFNVIYTGAPFTCIPLTVTVSASTVSRGGTQTVGATIANCGTTTQLMKLTSKTSSTCSFNAATGHSVPLPPLVQTVVSSSATVTCKGSYTDKLTLSIGKTVVATEKVTYQVT